MSRCNKQVFRRNSNALVISQWIKFCKYVLSNKFFRHMFKMNITQWTYQLYQLCTVYPWVSIKRYWIQLYNVRCIQERNNTFSKDTGTITCKCFSNLTSNYTAVIIISCTAQPWSVPQFYRITRYVTDVLLNTIDSWRSGNVSTSV